MLQINNLIGLSGLADYKTLNINQIILGTQIYDFKNNIAYLDYNGEFVEHDDIFVISEEEYNKAKETLDRNKVTIEDRLLSQEQRQNEQEQAIMELTALLSGGATNV